MLQTLTLTLVAPTGLYHAFAEGTFVLAVYRPLI
jgi:hypothetical protein